MRFVRHLLVLGVLGASLLAPVAHANDDGNGLSRPTLAAPSEWDGYSHSAGGGTTADGCGTRVIDNVSDMTKGRTDGLVAHVDHSVGCKHLIITTFAGAGIGEAQGNAGQKARCVEQGQWEAEMTFRFYFDTEIDPSSVKVACTNYSGDD